MIVRCTTVCAYKSVRVGTNRTQNQPDCKTESKNEVNLENESTFKSSINLSLGFEHRVILC